MEGFLNKQGEKGLVVNLWRKRWFQLDPNLQRMYYYKTKSKEELLGYINLAEGTLAPCAYRLPADRAGDPQTPHVTFTCPASPPRSTNLAFYPAQPPKSCLLNPRIPSALLYVRPERPKRDRFLTAPTLFVAGSDRSFYLF